MHCDLVGPHPEIPQSEASLGIGGCLSRQVDLRLASRNRRSIDNGSGRICHYSANSSVIQRFLGETAEGHREGGANNLQHSSSLHRTSSRSAKTNTSFDSALRCRSTLLMVI
jgi:hypothetical protein